MITYYRGNYAKDNILAYFRGNVCLRGIVIAFPSAVLTGIVKALFLSVDDVEELEKDTNIWRDNAIWSAFTFVLGFALVFRNSQSYTRFWDGIVSVKRMRAEWLDSYQAIIAFTRHSEKKSEVSEFQNLLARLFSMLHAAAIAEIQEADMTDLDDIEAFRLHLLDAGGLDPQTLTTLKNSDARVELIFQWIQQIIVDNIKPGVLSIPAPILSRAFQELSNGMVAFHDALNISSIPFPFPYAQTCDILLYLHWVVTPFVVAQCIEKMWWALVFGFLQVFLLWNLNFIAEELENPFGIDSTDLDVQGMQDELNRCLEVLILPSARRLPRLLASAIRFDRIEEDLLDMPQMTHTSNKSFSDVWKQLNLEGRPAESFATAVKKKQSISAARRSNGRRSARKFGSYRGSVGYRESEAVRIRSSNLEVAAVSSLADVDRISERGSEVGSEEILATQVDADRNASAIASGDSVATMACGNGLASATTQDSPHVIKVCSHSDAVVFEMLADCFVDHELRPNVEPRRIPGRDGVCQRYDDNLSMPLTPKKLPRPQLSQAPTVTPRQNGASLSSPQALPTPSV